MAYILIVEDDPNISKLIAASLNMAGHKSAICMDGHRAVELIFAESYDLILLDVMLPGLDGFTVIDRIRNRAVPVIFITAKGNVADRVAGLRLGAEDYIVKPFEPVELLARVEVVLRRSGRGSDGYQLGDITMSLSERVVRKGGKKIYLSPKEFDLLALLLQNANIALSREKMLAMVWGYSYQGETRTVDTHIQQLRKKLGLKNALRTVPKVGYRLERDDALLVEDIHPVPGAGDAGAARNGMDGDME